MPAVYRVLPSGLNWTPYVSVELVWNRSSSAPVRVSHTSAVRSSAPLATSRPSGE